MALKELGRRVSLALVSTFFAVGAAFHKKEEHNPMQSEKTAGKVQKKIGEIKKVFGK